MILAQIPKYSEKDSEGEKEPFDQSTSTTQTTLISKLPFLTPVSRKEKYKN
jgi:hypothetical protein